MAGTIVTMPTNGAADWSSFVTIVEKTYRGYIGISVTALNTTSAPTITDGSVIEVNGSIYQFTTAETITGWPSAGTAGNTLYIVAVPSGTTATVVFTASAPTWSGTKNGWYDSNDRYIGGLLWGGSATYDNKWIYQRFNDNDEVPRITESILQIHDEKAQNTNGGTFSAGAWETRVLNTIKTNEISDASLGSNQITLPAGTFSVTWSAPAQSVSGHQTRLFNTTDTAVLVLGTTEISVTGVLVQSRSFGEGRFTLSAPKVLELQHRCAGTIETFGFGNAANFTTEIYSVITIIKIKPS